MKSSTGIWTGSLTDTPETSILLALHQEDEKVSGVVSLFPQGHESAVYRCEGQSEAEHLNLALNSGDSSHELEEVGKVLGLESLMDTERTMSGTVDTEKGKLSFQAEKLSISPPAPSEQQAIAPLTAFNYEKQIRVHSCAIDLEMLRRLYRDLAHGAAEAARLEPMQQAQQGEPPLDQLYAVSILARGEGGDQVWTLDSSVLSKENLPSPLRSIEFQLGMQYSFFRRREPPNRVTVHFDLSKTPVVDLSNPSGTPTPNASSIVVSGSDSIWVAGVYEKIISTLAQGRVRTGWLHSSNIYDFLLIVIGLPVSLPAAALLAEWAASEQIGSSGWLGLAVFMFTLLVTLVLFRLSFSFVRWLLPYVEFRPVRAPLNRQLRVSLASLVLGALGSLIASAIWAIWAAT